MSSHRSLPEQLCLACGMCCNGVLFKDVELQPGDDAPTLASRGLPLELFRGKTRFPQPCAALGADCRCRLYPDRPKRCSDFECALFKAVAVGLNELPAALRVISRATRQAEQVRRLLRELGDVGEHLALSLRFKRTARRLEGHLPNELAAARFADLTLAVHDLNVLLRAEFYPGPGD